MRFLGTVITLAMVSCAPPSSTPVSRDAPTTIVSLTFDDTFADQFQVAAMVAARDMHATFYINSGRVNLASFMTQGQLLAIQQQGNEIAGHTVSHADLPTLDSDEERRQICNDRVALLGFGFAVSSFAYPFGDANATTEQIVADCGYNSARGVGDLVTPGGCNGCAFANPVPPADPYNVKTPDSIKIDTSLATLEGYVTQAEANGGGWVPLVMHHVCDGCDPLSVSPATLAAFLDWLAARADAGTVVETVGEVIGGPVLPGVAGPPPMPRPPAGNLLANPSLETDANGDQIPDCWQRGGSGTNSATFTLTTAAFDGSVAQRLDVTSFSSGARRLVSRQDLGSCAPVAYPGHSYVVSAQYLSTTAPRFTIYYRTASGGWVWFAQSPLLPTSASYVLGSYVVPPLPVGATAISIGLSIFDVGSITMDAFSLVDADATPPTVSLVTPTDGATVSGTVNLSATAADAGGVDHVDFLIDGQLVGTAHAPFAFAWDSTQVADDVVGLVARAVDLAGNSTLSTGRLITIANAAPIDVVPPVISLTAPADEAVVRGVVQLQATATDNVAIQHVEFLVEDLLVGSADTPPYQASWDSTLVPDGPVTITARAFDTSGNVATSTGLHVVVSQDPTDATAPVTTIGCNDAPCASGFYGAPVTVALTATDVGSGVAAIRYSLDGSSPSLVYAAPFSVAASAAVTVSAIDLAGNAEAPHAIAIAIDSTAPTIALSCNGGACATGYYNQPVAITLAATGLGASGLGEIRYTLDGSAPSQGLLYGGPFALSVSATVRFVATSGAGVASALGSQLVLVDTVAPTGVAITSPSSGSAVTGIAPIVAAASDDIGVYRVRFYLDGKQLGTRTVTPFRWNWDTSTTTKGTHVLSIQAEDAAGNATHSTGVVVTVH